jgi:hypothetical protein
MSEDLWTYPASVGRLDVTGYDVEAVDGDVGSVDETSLDAGTSYLVVDTGRWIFGKKILIPAGMVERVDRDEEKVYVARTKDELAQAPEFDQDRYREPGYREQLSAYYAASDGESETAERPTGAGSEDERS